MHICNPNLNAFFATVTGSPLQVLDIFEALEVQAEYVGQLLDLDALLSLLKAAACVTAELILSIKRFRRTACTITIQGHTMI